MLTPFPEFKTPDMKSSTESKPRPKTMSPLTRHRKAAGYTLVTWSKTLGVSVATAWGWENNMHGPSPDKYPRIAELLGITALEVTELVCPSQPATA